jgi:hypothetical protein
MYITDFYQEHASIATYHATRPQRRGREIQNQQTKIKIRDIESKLINQIKFEIQNQNPQTKSNHSVRANPNTTKRSKQNLQYSFRFSTKNLYKITQIKTKIKKSSLKIILTHKK